MTREEALHRVKGYLTDIIPTEDYNEVEEIIAALGQEPCDDVDCIDREQAKAAIRDRFKDLPSRVEINTILNELPSVTPQIKTGHWVKEYIDCVYDVCSECGQKITTGYFEYEYCPNCGAKMEESKL